MLSTLQAKAAAVKKIPGTAQSAAYGFEDGHWQYAVIIMAKTSPAEEATEAAADKKAGQ